jgi:hypothetical protein
VAPSVVMRRRMVFWLSPLASSATGGSTAPGWAVRRA